MAMFFYCVFTADQPIRMYDKECQYLRDAPLGLQGYALFQRGNDEGESSKTRRTEIRKRNMQKTKETLTHRSVRRRQVKDMDMSG